MFPNTFPTLGGAPQMGGMSNGTASFSVGGSPPMSAGQPSGQSPAPGSFLPGASQPPVSQPGGALPGASQMQMLNSNPYTQFQQAMQNMQRQQQGWRAPNVGSQFMNNWHPGMGIQLPYQPGSYASNFRPPPIPAGPLGPNGPGLGSFQSPQSGGF